MIVTHSTLEKALLRIFREQHMTRYSSLPFRELQGLWAYTGLRQSDLRDALRYMFEQNAIDFQNDGQGLSVVVTPHGASMMNDSELHLGSVLRDTRDKLSLHKASQRQDSRIAGGSTRMRAEDRPSAQ
ncbi:hypothetical protein [Oceanococcus atlanticus]|uniref:hypothetical protein n=1 Tax=Oceanococcus atlanticus TaxID=1317117 RepID=UPI0011BAD83A|nr:hypothetical protein [Oceanococcus atlanticus]RZO85226.1 MAG: hypothetical protein EVA65_09515 [Oceanococcus sp.]